MIETKAIPASIGRLFDILDELMAGTITPSRRKRGAVPRRSFAARS